jgi:2-succinyl-5-enolpyruvyl-6-hydroxy-3-cyclohexene-1-carboxylate synthase
LRPTNLKYLWADLIVEELVRCGVTVFCISPGARSTPLVLAAAEHNAVETVVHLDERGAAFYAVGYAKSTGRPAALICTSGTAVANCYPAVIEASASATPLVVLSADRPIELRDAGANQTIDQVGIFGKYTRWSFDLPSPNRDLPAEFVLTTVDQLAYRATRAPAGPVQLNCMFAEPLTPETDDSIPPGYLNGIDGWMQRTAPFTNYAIHRSLPDDVSLSEVSSALLNSKRGVIVAGSLDCRSNVGAVFNLASNLRMPLLADISSGLRFCESTRSNLVTHYDLFLRDEWSASNHQPDLVLHLGGPVVSKALMAYVNGSSAQHIVVERTPFRRDPGHTVAFRVEMEPLDFCERFASIKSTGDSGLLHRFRRADAASSQFLRDFDLISQMTSEFAVAYHLLGMLPSDSGLFLANSLAIRAADGCGMTGTKLIGVGVNRGASGIDGNLAAAVGFARGLGRRTALLIGDLALVHDISSLLLAKRSHVPVTIVLLNNDGGGIFSFLPIAKYRKHLDRFFEAPHGLDFRDAASLFDLRYFHPETVSQFRDCVAEAFDLTENSIVEVRIDRNGSPAVHQDIWNGAGEAASEALR